MLSPGIVSGAAGEDGPAGFRARFVTEFTMAAASRPFLPFARRGAPRRECGVSHRDDSGPATEKLGQLRPFMMVESFACYL